MMKRLTGWASGVTRAFVPVFLPLAVWALPAKADLPPVEHFTRPPALSNVALSPSGKRLAVLIFGTNGMRRVGVMNLDPVGEPRIVGGFDDADVTSARWVNEDRLVFEAFQRGAEIHSWGAGTFAVSHDGSDQRQLIAWARHTDSGAGSHIASRVLPYGWGLHSIPGDGSDDVFVYRGVWDSIGDRQSIQVARLNTRTRELRNLSLGLPDHTVGVLFDANGEPRSATAYHRGRTKVYLRREEGTWKEVADIDPLQETLEPWYAGSKDEVLLLARVGDTEGVHRWDVAAGKLDPEPLVRLKNFDLSTLPEVDPRARSLVGMHFVADRPMSYWFDERMAAIQKGLDAALPPGRSNRLYCGDCLSSRFLVVLSRSDQQPGEYYLYDRERRTLQLIGASRPWVDEAKQGQRTFHRFDARDGLKIPVVVTHPLGVPADTPAPTVVMVHGGPFERGSNLAWNAWAQFLASRGYRVLQPEFRGSEGFGHHHHRAGWKEWGHGMVDDVAETVKWAARQKLSDPKRVCVMGGSYGGYAALMSTIAHPGVYRCAASLAGVVDPAMMYSVTWSDLPQWSLKHALPVMMGDPDKDAARLAAASPLKRVAEIKVPVLLAHGGVDRRVPIVHAREFASAAEKAGVKLDRIEYLDEGHGFALAANEADFLRRLEVFLKTSLADPN